MPGTASSTTAFPQVAKAITGTNWNGHRFFGLTAVRKSTSNRNDPLAGGDDGRVAHDGDQIAVAARLRPEHAEAVLGVVEGDPLDEACENFLGRRSCA